ncbi:MAG: hypothetical protein SV375_24000, partial [Thermodesulfobacteriota bacterium]|nr:hypothetical protein [Thermodesulfobacteriota bacterium]
KEMIKISSQAVISNTGPKRTVALAGEEFFEGGYLKDTKALVPTPWTAIQVASDRPLVEFPGFAQVVDFKRRLNWISCSTILCPECAPPGKHLTLIGGWLPSNPPWDLKEELELNLADARELMPNFADHTEILHAGFFVGEIWPMFHSWYGQTIPTKTPVEHLYNVGDGVLPKGTGGLFGSAMSGAEVADDVKERISPQEE